MHGRAEKASGDVWSHDSDKTKRPAERCHRPGHQAAPDHRDAADPGDVRAGQAGIFISEKSDVQPFIINIGNAKAKDIKELIDFTKEAVLDRYNVELKCEQEFVNWE